VAEAQHPYAARLWLNWTLSRDGQSVWVKVVECGALGTEIQRQSEVQPGR
jgi:ABC-type Fe3+ transport system substrate-binding protein